MHQAGIVDSQQSVAISEPTQNLSEITPSDKQAILQMYQQVPKQEAFRQKHDTVLDALTPQVS